MALLAVKIKSCPDHTKKFLVEIDAQKLEKLAADFGLFNPDFLKSIEMAEKDYRAGRFKKIKSLKEIEK